MGIERTGDYKGFDIVTSAGGHTPGAYRAHFAIYKPSSSPPECVHSEDLPNDYPDLGAAHDAAQAAARDFVDQL